MKGEINHNRYCAGLNVENNGRFDYCTQRDEEIEIEICKGCRKFHRKWPTPEHFKEEYGEEYPNECIGYWKYRNSTIWKCDFYGDFKSYIAPTVEEAAEQKHQIFVCACTPWGKPPNDWRPE